MSENNIQAKIRNHPKFAEMVSKRSRFALVLSLAVLGPYYVFMAMVSLNPDFFTAKLNSASVITIGWPLAALIIVVSWLLTGVYISRANGEFDRLNAEILKEVRQ